MSLDVIFMTLTQREPIRDVTFQNNGKNLSFMCIATFLNGEKYRLSTAMAWTLLHRDKYRKNGNVEFGGCSRNIRKAKKERNKDKKEVACDSLDLNVIYTITIYKKCIAQFMERFKILGIIITNVLPIDKRFYINFDIY